MRFALAYRAAFLLGLLSYVACFLGGIGYFVAVHRALPGILIDPLRDAQVYLAQGDLRRAAREYRVASRISTVEWETSKKAADLAGKVGDPTVEVDKYLRARDLWPRDPATHRALALAYVRNGRFDEAMTSLRYALGVDPRDAATHAAIGDLHLERDQYAEAARWYRSALAIDPRAAGAHNGLGIAYALGGRSADAVAAFSEAVRLRPSEEFRGNLERARREERVRRGEAP
ncbi:MAG TPA: tetratricopeptide repeat protein [Vicinamibacteria bacterium]|nr:tetratricopeptide repeat protein [Vicinamibacteria bacterium]